MSLTTRNSIYSIYNYINTEFINFTSENEQFLTQNGLMIDDWRKKNFSTFKKSYKINIPPPIYIPSFILNLPIIKHHKQLNLQRKSSKNFNEIPEYTMIEIEEKVVSELLKKSKDFRPDFYLDLTDELNRDKEDKRKCSCWLKFNLIIYFGIILTTALLIGGIMILEKFT
ncbi:hypothetical protein C1645_814394 [Glomus cerebriforme]|uniref:Uncharacterized protein n=1 Tax=Glomus cerebriforme TaxID=658196 RepID=A0A397TFZ8_9GLOM|nr:hypothetical protein C1645_814394 [Glomus cerebriforme]